MSKKIVVKLEDQGQDFTEFVLEDQMIVEAWPFQTGVWAGYRVRPKTLRPGTRLKLSKPGKADLPLRYPVIGVEEWREGRHDPEPPRPGPAGQGRARGAA